MDKNPANVCVAPRVPQSRVTDFSCGYFSMTGCQLAQACLQHCLAGDPGRAATAGCAFIQRLVRRFSDTHDSEAGYDLNLPARHVCPKGYQVSIRRAPAESEVVLLALHPPLQHVPDHAMAQEAIQTLHRATLENWRLNQENEGLANEVLQCYEQVNLIFDISAEVATLTEESDVRRVLLEKLQMIYDADQVLCIDGATRHVLQVTQDGRFVQVRTDRLWALLENTAASPNAEILLPQEICGIPLPPETGPAIRRLQASPRAFVASSTDPELRKQGHGTSLWGPLRHNKDQIATVAVIRRGRFFEAGDMLLLDSTLTFGSHILGNMRLVEQLKQASFESVRALVNAIDQKDPYTCGHSERVGFLAKATGRLMNLSSKQLRELEWGGLLHDIGKIGIPEHVLNKPSKLTGDEFALIKDHPARGHSVLHPVASFAGVLDVVLHHHETPDGKGYPDGLAGDDIPLLARIVHVVDTFDALTSTRSYRRAFNHKRALEIMENDTGSKFDLQVMACFMKLLERLPQDYPEKYRRWFVFSEETDP